VSPRGKGICSFRIALRVAVSLTQIWRSTYSRTARPQHLLMRQMGCVLNILLLAREELLRQVNYSRLLR